jgi:hypothetical protein
MGKGKKGKDGNNFVCEYRNHLFHSSPFSPFPFFLLTRTVLLPFGVQLLHLAKVLWIWFAFFPCFRGLYHLRLGERNRVYGNLLQNERPTHKDVRCPNNPIDLVSTEPAGYTRPPIVAQLGLRCKFLSKIILRSFD